MLNGSLYEALRERIRNPVESALFDTITARAAPLLDRVPPVPAVKATLTRDGGVCPADGATLRFDPWSPDRHECPRCGQSFAGERHHGNWARAQHLWLAERTVDLAFQAAFGRDLRALYRVEEIYARYERLYFELPNRDNVLGPSRLFFSTYLESLWLTSYLAGAYLLRERKLLAADRETGVDNVAEAAANLIAEFNEGLSNRQTWHSAALTAVAVWFEDLGLHESSVEGRTGLLGHLADGFGEDGLWWEGENYHLFALRGLMQGIHWARALGTDLLEDPEVRAHFRAALLAPARSALPDLTYPARGDSRHGVSLAEPASLELWEIGRAWLSEDADLETWLGTLYAGDTPLPASERYDAWLHDAGRPRPSRYQRAGLSWWALAGMDPAPIRANQPWSPGSVLLEPQQLAVLRSDHVYASLECGPRTSGHGHPDRLHLTLFAGGRHWLPDAGTGSYVIPELAWYRSALAHNAPLVAGGNAGGGDAWCAAFDQAGGWAWCRGRSASITRSVVLGPGLLVDLLEPETRAEIGLPWHPSGGFAMVSAGRWEAAELDHPFVTGAERFVPAEPGGPLQLRFLEGEAALPALLLIPGAELLRATGPGLPGRPEQAFLLIRAASDAAPWTAVFDWQTDPDRRVRALAGSGLDLELTTGAGSLRLQRTSRGLSVEGPDGRCELAGLRDPPVRRRPLFTPQVPPESEAFAPRIEDPPLLDGSPNGFDGSAPLLLDGEHQYRRSEVPYDPGAFAAELMLNWDGESLYLAVQVTKAEVCCWNPGAPPRGLDNEPEDINADGVQVYWRIDATRRGFLLALLDDGSLAVRPLPGSQDSESVGIEASWQRTETGYTVTARLADPALAWLAPGARIGFDCAINEMRPERERRAGQLVWSGTEGGGWVYLRGDRHGWEHLGTLELG